MVTGRGLTDAKFFRDGKAADTVLHEVAVDLRGKVFFGLFEPSEDLEAAIVGQGAESGFE